MLDNFICCDNLFKRISDCKFTQSGVRSNHTAIVTKFRLTFIKFHNNWNKATTVVDWEKIRTDKKAKSDFNDKLNILFNNHSAKSPYTDFNSAILIAAKDTATKQRTKNQGWFHHSNSILLPAIHHRNRLLHHLRSQDPSEDTTAIRSQLKDAQAVVTDYVSLAKSAWSQHQAEMVHTMRFSPKEAWKSVQILAGGMTSHHEKPTVMQLRLQNGDLATTDAKNASVMGPHLAKVYQAHRPVDFSVLQDLPQRPMIPE